VKPILCFSLFCAVGLWADEARDRAAIDKAIAALNDPVQRANVLTKDVDSSVDFDRLIDLHCNNSSTVIRKPRHQIRSGAAPR
jgi:hypothetical protein